MQCGERPEDAQGDLECLGQGDLSPGDAIRERFAGEQLHDEIESLGIFGELVDLANIGMIETGGGPRFRRRRSSSESAEEPWRMRLIATAAPAARPELHTPRPFRPHPGCG